MRLVRVPCATDDAAEHREATVLMASTAALTACIAYLAMSLDHLMELVIEADEGWQACAFAAQALGNQIGWIADRSTRACGESGAKADADWLLSPRVADALAVAENAARPLAPVVSLPCGKATTKPAASDGSAAVLLESAAAVMSEIAYLAMSLDRLMDLVIEADEGWQDFALAAQALGNQIGWIADRSTRACGESGAKADAEWLLSPRAVDALTRAATVSAALTPVVGVPKSQAGRAEPPAARSGR
jgi:hypothetical protein